MLKDKRKINLLNESTIFDAFIMYQFLRKISTPFNKTKAFELGIIDEKGKVLRKRNTLRTVEERAAFTIFDVLVFNLKKLLEKLPGGKTLIASYAAALFLMREDHSIIYNESKFYQQFAIFLKALSDDKQSLANFNAFLSEEIKFSSDEAKKLGDSLGVDWNKFSLDQFQKGLSVEQEHNKGEYDVVDSLKDLGKIVLAHLDELPDYYTKLAKMEEEAPANSAGAGNIAGLQGDPPIHIKRKKKTFKDFA